MGIGSNPKGIVVNIYETSFYCKCPTNETRVLYNLKIETEEIIPVELLLTHIKQWYEEGFHELIADHLSETFDGVQTLKADHHSVQITTIRKGNGNRCDARGEK